MTRAEAKRLLPRLPVKFFHYKANTRRVLLRDRGKRLETAYVQVVQNSFNFHISTNKQHYRNISLNIAFI